MPTVTDRFFEAFDAILVRDAISIREFCRELGVDRRNFLKQRDDHSRCILKPEWLTFLVERYGVDSAWLLTGRGRMFSNRNE